MARGRGGFEGHRLFVNQLIRTYELDLSGSPVVYSDRVLFSEMTSYGDDLYDLWDCNLVEP